MTEQQKLKENLAAILEAIEDVTTGKARKVILEQGVTIYKCTGLVRIDLKEEM